MNELPSKSSLNSIANDASALQQWILGLEKDEDIAGGAGDFSGRVLGI